MMEIVKSDFEKMIRPRKSVRRFIRQFDEHNQELIRGVSAAFLLKVLGAGFSFGLSVVLARLLGAAGSGIFFLAFTIVVILATFGRVGMENALIRFIAANISADKPGKVLGDYQKAMLYSLIVSANSNFSCSSSEYIFLELLGYLYSGLQSNVISERGIFSDNSFFIS